ncbi:Alpha/Beta hydrolase protein [Penicillium chermesinum]|uniref:Alpha/Beta hydrolase protein n=1 Tax=Penicillium chermesinum TaxID=63820 RepID=A0A9W9TS71_9EURO|nr:Alpha/Beta hydrolase protein [Penicillium chermesinum]KAJ5239227.1 Alpha/Beta hydrolase protein [Penicillium chermesinum]KAJ6164860.1 Alpha/Beta hydrolase protein [Penicillium chermesinum]
MKPSAIISFTFQAPVGEGNSLLVVFLNGWGLSQQFRALIIAKLKSLSRQMLPQRPSAQLANSSKKIFHPSVGSKEGLSRSNLPSLLPESDKPILQGPDGNVPFVTIVGHDFHTFAAESAPMGNPESVTKAYTNPFLALL